ncbi:hypothetical protein HMPREF3181_00998, partial [Parvimonas sp. KA00067]
CYEFLFHSKPPKIKYKKKLVNKISYDRIVTYKTTLVNIFFDICIIKI